MVHVDSVVGIKSNIHTDLLSLLQVGSYQDLTGENSKDHQKRAKADKPDKTLFGDKDHMAPVNPTPMKRQEGSVRGDLVPDYGGKLCQINLFVDSVVRYINV